jgi:hypothetical protein
VDKNAQDDVAAMDAALHEVAGLRRRTQSVVQQLQARLTVGKQQLKGAVTQVKRLGNLRHEAAEHPLAASGIGLGTLLAGGVAIYFTVVHLRRERTLTRRLQRRAQAYGTMLAHPDRALRPREPLGRRLVAALLTAAAASLARTLVERTLATPEDRRRTTAG